MASRIRNSDWEDDETLEEDLKMYVKSNFHQSEILDLVKVKFPMYAWSLRSLSRRLCYFGIKYTDYEVDVEEVKNAVEKELNGPGNLLGYRALHKKIREIHGLNVPRNLVNAVLSELDPQGLQDRGGVGQAKRPKRQRIFTSNGSDYTMSLDGHDKMCGYQNATFPLCIYGAQDTYSGHIRFLRIWTTNSDPKIIGRFYLDYLYECRVLPQRIRVDKGTETGIMTTMHCFLIDKKTDLEDATESVLFGPSTQNKIERWWRELLERMEKYFKLQLSTLIEDGDYDATDEIDRNLLAYIYVPVLQRELDTFRVTVWNNHRIRKQSNKELPTGIPDHIYNCPWEYGANKCGIKVNEEDLKEVAELSGVLDDTDDYLEPEVRRECERHISNADDIESSQAANAYLFLKAQFDVNML